MSNPAAKIVVLSTRAIFRDCLVCFLERQGFADVVGVPTLAALSGDRGNAAPEVLFIDLGEESDDARETVHAVRGWWPDATVVALGTPLQLGAHAREVDGCIEFCTARAHDIATMAAAIERPHQGRLLFAPSAEVARQQEKWGLLTGREREVLDVLTSGADNLKIAETLGISERTVKAHLTRLFEKLGTENRTELALLASHAGLHYPKSHDSLLGVKTLQSRDRRGGGDLQVV